MGVRNKALNKQSAANIRLRLAACKTLGLILLTIRSTVGSNRS